MEYTIKMRRDPDFRWMKVNPVLAEGEPGLETNSGKFKIGDGMTAWAELPYFVPGSGSGDVPLDLEEHINSATPHPVYDDGPSLSLLYQNAKV